MSSSEKLRFVSYNNLRRLSTTKPEFIERGKIFSRQELIGIAEKSNALITEIISLVETGDTVPQKTKRQVDQTETNAPNLNDKDETVKLVKNIIALSNSEDVNNKAINDDSNNSTSMKTDLSETNIAGPYEEQISSRENSIITNSQKSQEMSSNKFKTVNKPDTDSRLNNYKSASLDNAYFTKTLITEIISRVEDAVTKSINDKELTALKNTNQINREINDGNKHVLNSSTNSDTIEEQNFSEQQNVQYEKISTISNTDEKEELAEIVDQPGVSNSSVSATPQKPFSDTH